MNIGKILKAIAKIAPVVLPAAPLVIAGGKAVLRSQKKGGSLVDELPAIMAGVSAAHAVADALKKKPQPAS
jgi:hypothetical protein